jgi:hypothetical protein
MTGIADAQDYDEEAAIEAARERNAAPHPRDIFRREDEERAKRPRNIALEKHGAKLEAQIIAALARD